jgi:pimeloyl-ACP methyl ester carboxylesterase
MQARRDSVWLSGCPGVMLAAAFLAIGAGHARADSDVYFDVSVRGTGSAELHAHVFTNPSASGGSTILAVHGLTETGYDWGPLASAFYAEGTLNTRVKQIVAIDFVGHGGSSDPSGLPGGAKFGDLTINDNISVLLQAIDILKARGLGARVIMGHSMGGLAIQGAQEALLAQNSSLFAHGIVGAILIAPVPTSSSPYHEPAANVASFIQTTDALGSFLQLPDSVWPYAGGFTTLSGSVVASAPTPAVVTANDYNGIEPLTALLQLGDQIPQLPRPAVRQGAFAPRNGTLLALYSFSQDVLVPAGDLGPLYTYLIGRNGLLYRNIVADDAVHSMFISNPSGLIQALKDLRDIW